MSESGQSRRFDGGADMSASPLDCGRIGAQQRTMRCATSRLMHRSKGPSLFDHLVGAGEQCRWNVEAELLAALRLTTSSYLVGACTEVGRLLALEDAVDVSGGLPVLVDVIRPIDAKCPVVADEIFRCAVPRERFGNLCGSALIHPSVAPPRVPAHRSDRWYSRRPGWARAERGRLRAHQESPRPLPAMARGWRDI